MADNPQDNQRGTLLVIDGHSLAFRAFYALPVENFTTADGRPTNAVWGFATMLSQVVAAEQPDHLAVAFDVKGGTFRNDMLPQYKGTREAAPEELLSQLPVIQRMLGALGVTYIECPGYEGDDVIATLASMGEREGYNTLILSGDRDAFQLVNDRVTVLYPAHHFKDLKRMTPEAVVEKYHVTAQQYPDLAALRGETADNIPGVPGVGDGFAAKWINQYGGLDGIVEHAADITGKKGEALREHLDQVLLNRKVNALVRDVELDVGMDDLTFGSLHADEATALFADLEFGVRTRNRILKVFNGGERPETTQKEDAEPQGVQAPHCQDIESAQALRTWLDAHCEPVKASAANVQKKTPATDSVDHADSTAQWSIDHEAHAQDVLTGLWVLHADGMAQSDTASVVQVAILCGTEAAVLTWPWKPEVTEALNELVHRYRGTMAVHGYKQQRHRLHSIGVQLEEPGFDTKLAAYLMHPDVTLDTLDQTCAYVLHTHMQAEETVSQGMLDLGDEDSVSATPQVAISAAAVRELTSALAKGLDERSQFGLLRSLELPVASVLYDMECAGACVDMARLEKMRDTFSADAEQAQAIAWQCAGSEVNLQSPKQLQTVLFEELGLKPTKRTKNGGYTTNAAALQDLYLRSADNERANGFLGALLRHRETNKLKQIVQTLIDATDADGRIHTTFEQTVAATGRLSSVDPNLQNIPNRNASGREIRSAFVPGEGYESLLSCDYSQVELRIMADRSGDESLVEAFRSGVDFHRYVASLVYGVPVDAIGADQRGHVKAMSYGLAYGLSTYGLSQQLNITPAEADSLKRQYFATFGKVHDYLESLVATAHDDGYTETMFGRRRYFPGLASTSRMVREAAERGALNAPIQGSAADIMKIAMLRTHEALRREGLRSRIILQIHDELVLEIAPGEREQVSQLVREAMEHAVRLSVPLDVSIGIGDDWQLAAH